MKTQRHKNLISELKHIETTNLLAPFPVYDTEYVSHVKEQINNIENSYDK